MKETVFAFLCGFFTLAYQTTIAQENLTCGTIADEQAIKALKGLNLSNFRVASDTEVVLAITAHVIRRSSGNGGLDSAALYQAVQKMNKSYEGSGLAFYIDGAINYIDNDDYLSFDASQELEITSVNNVPETINIYFFGSLTAGEANLCGYAYFPNTGRDHIMMRNSCTINGSTLAHEVGHYLALYHTHGKTNNGTTDELVDGSNCSETGDDVCDTPADPNLSGVVNPDLCAYIGAGTDSNGDFFVPDVRNIMSYSNDDCMVLFTQGQKDRMKATYLNFKSYLKKKELFADFGITTGKPCVGNTVQLKNSSVGGVSFSWEFEGGVPAISTDVNPSVVFEQAGFHKIKLTATNGDQSSVLLDSIQVYADSPSSSDFLEGGFEEENNEFLIYNPDRDVTWEQIDTLAFEGQNAMRMNFYRNENAGSEDLLLLPAVSTQNDKYYELRFRYAYSGYDSTYADSLEMLYRADCGSWESIWKKGGDDLRTTNAQRREFNPRRNEWSIAKAEFAVNEEVDEIEVAIRAVNGLGNALYLDDYRLSPNDPSFRISSLEIVNASCPASEDGRVVVNVDGNAEAEYRIGDLEFGSDNVFENLAEGEYEVQVRNLTTGFIESEPVTISAISTYPTKPTLTFAGDRLQASVSLLPGQFLVWYKDGFLLEGQDRSNITEPEPGVYQVAVSNGICESLSESIAIEVLGIEDNSGLQVYPNPFKDVLRINISNEFISEVQEVTIWNTSGKIVFKSDSFEENIDLTGVSKGLYVLRVQMKNREITRSVLKN